MIHRGGVTFTLPPIVRKALKRYKITIVQMPMHSTPEENTRSVVDHLAQAKALSADMAVFPECSATGYHRRVPEQIRRRSIADSLEQIQAQCAALELPAVVGTPFFPGAEEDRIWNAAVAIGADGEIQAVCPKAGLTQSERRFFHPGSTRPTSSLGTVSCSALLCREVRDAEQLLPQLRGVDLAFWPGVISWDNDPYAHPDDDVTIAIAQACARTLGSYLVQCNWPNSVNRPELTAMGGSLVISPTGELVHQCPIDQAGISVVTVDVQDRGGAPSLAHGAARSGIVENPRGWSALSARLDSIPGARVRVVASNATRYTTVGTVGYVAADTLFLTRDRSLHAAVPLPSIQVIDQSRGRGRSALIGGGIGALVGVAGGFIGSYLQDRPAPSFGRHVAEVGGITILVGLIGGAIGAAVGESWVQIFPGR